VDQPAGVPTLGTPVPDRASLDDPTRDASREAALTAAPPPRSNPAPFLRPPSSDPFENRETIKVKTPLLEEAVPVSTPARTPK
jgi:hypothetical protein